MVFRRIAGVSALLAVLRSAALGRLGGWDGILRWGRRRVLGGIGIAMAVLGLVSAAVRMTQREVGTGPAVAAGALTASPSAAYTVWLALPLGQAPL